MKAGRASQTAELVCMARAVAHGRTQVERFEDPTALLLLPDEARERVERVRTKAAPRNPREGFQQGHLERLSHMTAVRTVTVDDFVRQSPAPQLVILGAGLDGRAWRMSELRDVVVFEVDHPDSQRDKRARIEALPHVARDVRFVAVDFERDSLDEALTRAGHDGSQPTTWIWEGVVMYLAQRDIEATLSVIERRSAAGSRLCIVYHSPALILLLVGILVRRLGEPLRSSFTAKAMKKLLARFGFSVVRDEHVREIGARVSPEVARATRPMKHARIVSAERAHSPAE